MIGTAYDDLGRQASVTSYGDTAGTVVRNQIAWTYDGFGNVSASAQAHNGLTGAGTPTVQYGWDYGIVGGEARYNRLSSMTYSGGRVVGYDYGSTGVSPVLGQVMGITNGSGTQTYATYGYLGEGTIYSVTTSVASLNYDPAEDGSFTGWDELGRVVGQTWKNPGGTALDSCSYTYDHAGNRLTRTNNISSIYSESYQYDGLDRLIDADRDGADLQSWDLDQVGNWAGFTDRGSSQTRTTNAANELQSISGAYTPAYDAAGNLTVMPDPKAMSQYLGAQWDAWNRLTGVFDSGGTVAEYAYDGLNRRVSKTVGTGQDAVTTDYIYNENWQVVEEVATNANHQPLATNHYVWDLRYIDSPVVRFLDANADGDLADAGDSTLYYLTDANMNVTALVDGTDGSATEGQVVERYVYDPYGKHLVLAGNWQPATGNSSAYDNAIRFGGYRFDAETGLFQVRNRYLHVTIGWISRDPEGYVDGMGLYQYVTNSPLTSTDPFGLRGLWNRQPDTYSFTYVEEMRDGQPYGVVRIYFTESFTFGPDFTSCVSRFDFPIRDQKQVSELRRRLTDQLNIANEEALISDLKQTMGQWPIGKTLYHVNDGEYGEALKWGGLDLALTLSPTVLARGPLVAGSFRIATEKVAGVVLLERTAAGALIETYANGSVLARSLAPQGLTALGEGLSSFPSQTAITLSGETALPHLARTAVASGELAAPTISLASTSAQAASAVAAKTAVQGIAGGNNSIVGTAGEALNTTMFAEHNLWRAALSLPSAGTLANEATPVALARLDVPGRTIWGISAHGQKVTLRVNPISLTHAETDAFSQYARLDLKVDAATLTVDRALCVPCWDKGAIRSLANQVGLSELTIQSPNVYTSISTKALP